MAGPDLLPLADWESFYVIIGSSAAALTGLMFVVIALGAEAKVLGGETAVRAFGTPTVVHFCTSLLISALLSAPWHSVSGCGFVLGASGLVGIIYVGVVFRHARRQSGYKPVLEDWIWHVVLPLVAYLGLVASGIMLSRDLEPALFLVAGTALLLLYIGIHNAWDAATYMVQQRKGG